MTARNNISSIIDVRHMGCWVIAGCLFALGQGSLYAQQSKIPWSSQSSGFAVMRSGSVTTASSIGQTAVGTSMNSRIRIESGFLADTTLRGITRYCGMRVLCQAG